MRLGLPFQLRIFSCSFDASEKNGQISREFGCRRSLSSSHSVVGEHVGRVDYWWHGT
jgi:hypothetical protein